MELLRAHEKSTIANHKAYPKIMFKYNELLARDGKVNAKKFFEEVVTKEVPSIKLVTWYYFLKQYKTEIGLQPFADTKINGPTNNQLEQTRQVILSNNDALQQSIAHAMNISAQALKEIMDNPELIPPEKRAELFLKVMKAQDSRVKTIGAMRADNREQERFERAMDSAAFN